MNTLNSDHHPRRDVGQESSSFALLNQRFAPYAEKMRAAGLADNLISLFRSYYRQVLLGQTGMIEEESIEPVRAGSVPQLSDLSVDDEEHGREMLPQAVMIKLNGGLGTSMGMAHAKSLLKVRDDLTFLDITLLQARGCRGRLDYRFPLVLMDSFSTHEETLDHFRVKGMEEKELPLSFVQHKYPKIMARTLEPAHWPQDPELEWNPPGHGDLYAALVTSGTLARLLEAGKRYAFVSNIDNLGAVLDLGVLGYFARKGFPFLMEVARRTKADTKGGHLARLHDGRLILRELAQCPEKDLDRFQDVSLYCYFNTNNIWLDLQKFHDYVAENGLPRLPLILNPKTLDPREDASPRIFQVETAMGAAISAFTDASVIRVGRERFIPVKKCSDLLAVRSDCYRFTEACELMHNSRRVLGTIVIDLDPRFYRQVDQLDARFPAGPPSLVHCASLTVRGDVLFGADVVCRGDVRVVNNSPVQAVVPPGTELDGDLVLG